MSANPPRYRTAVVVVALLVAAVAPSIGATAATGGTGATAVNGATAPDASFEQNVVYEQRGDVMSVTVRTSKGGVVNFGSPDHGFLLKVRVNKGTTELHLDTYKAGRTGTYSLDEMVWASKGGAAVVGLWTDPLDAPLERAEYPMNVTIDGVERDLAAFVVEDRATNDVSARIAPRATDVGELSPDEVAGATTPLADNGTVARGDWLVLRVEASGLDGVLSKAILDGDRHGVAMSFERSNLEMNAEPNSFHGDATRRLVAHPDGEGFYLFVDTAEHDIRAGDQYEATFSVAGDSHLADEREAVSTTFRVVERRVDLEYDGSELVVEGETTLDGTTTLAPGSTVNLTVRDEEIAPLFDPRTATVTPDRTFAATFDFSDVEPGRSFELRLRDQGMIIDSVVGPLPTTVPETTETPEPTTTETPEPTTTEPPETTTTATTTAETTAAGLTQVTEDADGPLTQRTVVGSSGGVPGFDALLSLVALVAGGLLAVRRS